MFSVPTPNTERGTKELPAAQRVSKRSQGALSFASGLLEVSLILLGDLSQVAENLAAQVLGFHSQ